jgi:dTDP-4-dehydrorhamnose 3,5-epimerase
VIRAWQGHREESKIFFVISGSFKIAAIKINNWKEPNQELPCQSYVLNASRPQMLLLPGGFANGIIALVKDFILIVFSEFNMNDTPGDDHRWELEYFKCWQDAFNMASEEIA